MQVAELRHGCSCHCGLTCVAMCDGVCPTAWALVVNSCSADHDKYREGSINTLDLAPLTSQFPGTLAGPCSLRNVVICYVLGDPLINALARASRNGRWMLLHLRVPSRLELPLVL